MVYYWVPNYPQTEQLKTDNTCLLTQSLGAWELGDMWLRSSGADAWEGFGQALGQGHSFLNDLLRSASKFTHMAGASPHGPLHRAAQYTVSPE